MATYQGTNVEFPIPSEGEVFRWGDMVMKRSGGDILQLGSQYENPEFKSIYQSAPQYTDAQRLWEKGLFNLNTTPLGLGGLSQFQSSAAPSNEVIIQGIDPTNPNRSAFSSSLTGEFQKEGQGQGIVVGGQSYTPDQYQKASEATILSSSGARKETEQNQIDLAKIQAGISQAQQTAQLATQQKATDIKAGQPQQFQPGTSVSIGNLSGTPSGQKQTDDFNAAASSGSVDPDTLAATKKAEADALAALNNAQSAADTGDWKSLAFWKKKYDDDRKRLDALVQGYLADTTKLRERMLASLTPTQKEQEISKQIKDLRMEAEQFALQTEKDKLSEFAGQTLGFAQGRASEIDFKASFRKQEQALKEKNLLLDLGLLQDARQYEGKVLEAQLGFIKDNFELQTKIEDKLTAQEESLFEKANTLSTDAKNTLLKFIDDLEGIDPDKMNPATAEKLKSLATQAGLPFDLVSEALKAQWQRTTYERAKEAASNTEVVEVNGNKVLIDSVTGKTIKVLGKADSGSGITTTPQNQPFVDAFNSAVLGLPKAQMEQASKTFNELLNRGDMEGAKNYIIRTAMAGAGVDQQNQAIGRKQALDTMVAIKGLIAKLPTNLVTGTLENIAQKAGASSNPDLAYIGSQIQQQIQVYRRAMTGVAFNPAESTEYAKIFPDITNVGTLNNTKIESLIDSFNRNNRSALSFYIGDTNYDALFGKYETPSLPSERVNDEQLKKEYEAYKQQQSGSSTQTSTPTFDLTENPDGFFSSFLKVFGF